MKALVYDRYGPPESVRFDDIDKPVPKEGEILVRVAAASVNPYDWRLVTADPFLVRLSAGLFRPKNGSLGADFSGTVEAVGPNVRSFSPGDAVFGEVEQGSFAEHLCVRESMAVHKPAKTSFVHAASLPMVGLTAIQALHDDSSVGTGTRVLINGASGGIGTFAVQYAKHRGAHVTGVCSSHNRELVLSLGADEVIDYTSEDVTAREKEWDIVLDAVGNLTIKQVLRITVSGGTVLKAGFTTFSNMLPFLVHNNKKPRKNGALIRVVTIKEPGDKLRMIKELLEADHIHAVVDRIYPFVETADALVYSRNGHARGKIVVEMG
ncbi:MAG: NAD(P)-dependent alcohol dehydrogenase [Spirochaetota bacterium]